MAVTQELGSITVQDLHGEPYRLGDAWSGRPVVLMFIRHFG